MLRAGINVTLTARGRGRRAGGRLSVLIGHRRLHVAGHVRIDPFRRWTLAYLIVSKLGELREMLVHLLLHLFHPQPEVLGPVRERRSEQCKPQRLDYGVTASPGNTIEEQRVLHRATPQESLEKVTSSSLVRPARTLSNVGILSRDYCNSTTFKGVLAGTTWLNSRRAGRMLENFCDRIGHSRAASQITCDGEGGWTLRP